MVCRNKVFHVRVLKSLCYFFHLFVVILIAKWDKSFQWTYKHLPKITATFLQVWETWHIHGTQHPKWSNTHYVKWKTFSQISLILWQVSASINLSVLKIFFCYMAYKKMFSKDFNSIYCSYPPYLTKHWSISNKNIQHIITFLI